MAARAAVLAACGIFAAACGSAAAPAGQGTQAGGSSGAPSPAATPSATASTGPNGSASPTPAAPAQVNLSITVAGSKALHWTIRCEPASGNIPDPGKACRRLLGQPAIFAPTSHHVMCPQVMTDAPAFFVTGIFRGVHIHDTIVAGGCSLGKWAALHAIFH